MDTEILAGTIRFIRELFRTDAGGHDAEHSIRVYRNAMRIADAEPACDRQIVALAALLHDADDHKLFRTENNANARRFLREMQIPEDRIDRICGVINGVSFSQNGERKPSSLEGQIVQDADRLDAIGAVGIARTFAYGGEHGRPMAESVQHFYDKLLRLKERMNTETAKNMAVVRHERMKTFLTDWYEETGDPDPRQ